ncbi:FTR1 family iron permease [Ensifer adhaerens]
MLLREGLEAVLVLACMIGALKASGVPAGGVDGWRRPAISGVMAALAGSFILWLAVGKVFAMTTLQREMLEGTTALTAAAVLIYVTHWIFRKAYVSDWVRDIRRKTAAAAEGGIDGKSAYLGRFTLLSLAFLVVFREGFETVLFYEALLVDAPVLPVLAGLLVGGLLAGAAAYAMLALEVKLPVGAFFRLTGALLAILCVTLVGSGVRGLQTAALVSATPVAWFPDVPWLQLYFGLYPESEALLAQAIVASLLIWSVAWLLSVKTRRSLDGSAWRWPPAIAADRSVCDLTSQRPVLGKG